MKLSHVTLSKITAQSTIPSDKALSRDGALMEMKSLITVYFMLFAVSGEKSQPTRVNSSKRDTILRCLQMDHFAMLTIHYRS